MVMVSSSSSTLGHRYEVSALLTEVAPQEGLLQAFDSLQTLDAVISDVFTRIQNRISVERAKITEVVARVGRAQSKVAEIGANATRVTTIFSTAKYPAPKVLPDFKRVIEQEAPSENRGYYLPAIRTSHRIAAKDRFVAAPPADTSALYTSMTTARLLRSEHAMADEETELAEGLGRLPAYLPSISSVLLFNSDENPYKQYVTINNLEGVGGQDRATDAAGPSAAPKSLIDGLELPTYAGFTFEYKPSMGEMPTFDLPQNLPLGKLADIAFGVDQTLSIAPSMATLALPNLDMLALPMPSRPNQPSAVPTNAFTSSTPASTSSSVPSAPAPTTTTSVPTAPVPTAPTPTAPPITSSSAPTAPAGPPTTAPTSKPPAASGGRGALLDAIRDAKNAKKLKKVSPGTVGAGRPTGGKKPTPAAKKAAADGGEGEESSSKAPPPSDGGGDMMSALRDRLARRQQAMSGKGEIEPAAAAKPAMAPRRMSVAPRLGTPNAAASLLKGVGGAKGKAAVAEEGEADAEGDKESKMSSAVLSAYVSAHAKKQEKDEEWE